MLNRSVILQQTDKHITQLTQQILAMHENELYVQMEDKQQI